MAAVRYTRNLFLRGMCIVYLFAFTSFYVQIPGLYGTHGVLPARTQMSIKGADSVLSRMNIKPTLLWFAPYLNLDTEYMMDFLAILGILLSFIGFVSQQFCSVSLFGALWSLYFSLYQVGQTFMWFQWDILLLEAGFLSIILAPWTRSGSRKRSQSDGVTFWLVRWLLFRFMFSSGVVKLTSDCPMWWSLSALDVHFESQCIPTPLAWYSHHLPKWILHLTTAFAIVIEIFVPALFFFPLRSVRLVAFFLQVFLQVNIILTGNYNFFNLLTITLCLSLLDDDFFFKNGVERSYLKKTLSNIVCFVVYGIVFLAAAALFGVQFTSSGILDSKITFTKEEFDNMLVRAIPFSVLLGLFSLVMTLATALSKAVMELTLSWQKVSKFLSCLLYCGTALFLFGISVVPFSTLHANANTTVVPEVRTWYVRTQNYHIVNSYGLFRRMTGVDGRPEVIIEGSNSLEGPWHEYHFLYKPGNVNNTLPFVAPYQPRLDWQMWFAALGTYHQNPWLMSLTYRLLSGQPEVLQLLDNSRNPFPNKPPKYIKASLYHYHYTSWEKRWDHSWWTREKVSEYFPIFSRDHPPLLDFLSNMKILGSAAKEAPPNPMLKYVFDSLRKVTSSIEASILLLSLFITGCVLITSGWIPQVKPVKRGR